jgi:drug/metabolite transporter (DMT)-like permease
MRRPDPSRPSLRVHAVLCLVQVIFGLFHVVGKRVLVEMDPLALAGLRAVGAAPLLAWVAWRHDRVLPQRADLPLLALLGLLGVVGNQLLFVLGLRFTTATNAAILMVSVPVLTAGVAAALGVERITPARALGVALSVAGALVLLQPQNFDLGGGTGGAAWGNALILTNCLCYSLFLVLQRPLLERLPWRTVIAGAFLLGGLLMLPLTAPALAALPGRHLSATAWWGVGYIVIFPTAVGYGLSTWAVRRSSPALVAAYNTLQPLIAASLGAAFLGEIFGWVEGIGFALIVAGLWRVSAGGSSRAKGVETAQTRGTTRS